MQSVRLGLLGSGRGGAGPGRRDHSSMFRYERSLVMQASGPPPVPYPFLLPLYYVERRLDTSLRDESESQAM